MNFHSITQLLESPSDSVVFWIDWRQEDESIPESCEAVLQSGSLSGELVEVDTDDGYEVYIKYKNKRLQVPLSYSGDDRNLTLATLNEILTPDYEIRFCHASSGSDTRAFAPLASSQWAELERKYGKTVGDHFAKLSDYPNLF